MWRGATSDNEEEEEDDDDVFELYNVRAAGSVLCVSLFISESEQQRSSANIYTDSTRKRELRLWSTSSSRVKVFTNRRVLFLVSLVTVVV